MMTRLLSHIPLLLTTVMMMNNDLNAASTKGERILFSFRGMDSANNWKAVNDGVMGGVSEGKFRLTEKNTMEFYGNLSLKNNGGFASVRSKPKNLKLGEGDTIVARIRGDGRKYSLNLYVSGFRVAYSWRASIQTKANQWMEVQIPLKDLTPTSFGRKIRNAGTVDPRKVNAIGFLLGDKKEGEFKLEVDWIKVISPTSTN